MTLPSSETHKVRQLQSTKHDPFKSPLGVDGGNHFVGGGRTPVVLVGGVSEVNGET
jgi:hypothetical protein